MIAGGLLCSLSLLLFPTNDLVHAETTVNNKVDNIVTILANTKYNYDLDGDGDNDEFYYESIASSNPDDNYAATLKLYINNKLCLTRKDGGFGYYMQLCDVDTSDSYLDLYVNNSMESDGVKYCSFARYDGEKVTEITGIKESKANKDFGLFRFGLEKINGDGTFRIDADTPIYSEAIGCYLCYLNYEIKDNKIVAIPEKSYSFTKYSKDYKYKATRAFTVYKTAGSKKVAFQVKKGATLHFDKLYVSPSGKAYVRAKNSAGKTGWIRADKKDLFYERPLWG